MTGKCECYATVSKDDPRFPIWLAVAENRIPIKHPLEVKGKAGGHKGNFYEGDATRLTKEQKEIMSKLLARKFHITEKEVLTDFEKGMFPIRADNISLVICELHLRCMI